MERLLQRLPCAYTSSPTSFASAISRWIKLSKISSKWWMLCWLLSCPSTWKKKICPKWVERRGMKHESGCQVRKLSIGASRCIRRAERYRRITAVIGGCDRLIKQFSNVVDRITPVGFARDNQLKGERATTAEHVERNWITFHKKSVTSIENMLH